jgi:acyl-CoA reductase-like NAD-dependent aldehyde dehydrogenase
MISASTNVLSEVVPSCQQQQREWARRSVRERLRPLRAFRQSLVDRCDELCTAVARDQGKPPEEALAGEILPLAAACRFLQKEAARLLRPRRVSGTHLPIWLWPQKDWVYRRPRGIVGIIGTWNYPIMLNGVQIVHALTAGNGVLWKPSELAPSTATVICDLLDKAGYPPDLVHLLPATRDAGQDLANADVDHIIFTGSSATGRRLAENLGRRLISSTLELSGCDALFVLDDADVNMAAKAAWFGACLNRGQTCLASRRVLVHRSLYPAFVDALKPLLAGTSPMRLALESQVQQARRLVHEAMAEGAASLDTEGLASENGDLSLCPPTVVLDAKPDMAICQEASFAPLVAIMPFDTIEQALRMNARCAFGLGASIFTHHPQRALLLAAQLKAGSVAINDVIVPTAHPATPFGGRGESGWGVTQGAEGLLEMTVPQVVSIRGGKLRLHYDAVNGAPPLTAEGFQGLLQLGHSASLRQRIGGLLRILRARRKE